jgi:hypothetical protein
LATFSIEASTGEERLQGFSPKWLCRHPTVAAWFHRTKCFRLAHPLEFARPRTAYFFSLFSRFFLTPPPSPLYNQQLGDSHIRPAWNSQPKFARSQEIVGAQ